MFSLRLRDPEATTVFLSEQPAPPSNMTGAHIQLFMGTGHRGRIQTVGHVCQYPGIIASAVITARASLTLPNSTDTPLLRLWRMLSFKDNCDNSFHCLALVLIFQIKKLGLIEVRGNKLKLIQLSELQFQSRPL